jgi:hypothetical protein
VTQEPSRSGQDPIGDFQRWLVRSGARSVSREVSDQIRSMLGVGGAPADVWAKATVPPASEAPECAWCPICRAARALRDSKPGVGSQMAAAGEAVGGLARDAMSVFESAVAATGRAAKAGAGQGQTPSSSVWADVTAADTAAADTTATDTAATDTAATDTTATDTAATDTAATDTAATDTAATGTAATDTEPAPGPAEAPESAGPAEGPPDEPDNRG